MSHQTFSLGAVTTAMMTLVAGCAAGTPADGDLVARVQPAEERIVGGCYDYDLPDGGTETMCADGLATFYPVEVTARDGRALDPVTDAEAAIAAATKACLAAGYGPVDPDGVILNGAGLYFSSCGYQAPEE